MSCRKVSRELLERFRFGEELDARSAPHLEHLQTCLACREEVGIDRALVTQLRRALQARVEGYAPSPTSWQLVRDRALAADERGLAWSTWFGRLTAGLRAAGAVAAVAFVVMLGAGSQDASEQLALFQERQQTWRGEVARANALPTDLPPYQRPVPFYGTPLPPPPPASGRFSVIETYTATGEPLATTQPAPRPVSGLLR
jgi:anti-sigma factor RsiW